MTIEFCKNDVINAAKNRIKALQQLVADNQSLIDSQRQQYAVLKESALGRNMTAKEYRALYPIAKTDNDFVAENAEIAAKREEISQLEQGNSPFKYSRIDEINRDIAMLQSVKKRAIEADTKARADGLQVAMTEAEFLALYQLQTEFPDQQTAIDEADREADKLGKFLASGTGQFEGYFDTEYLQGTAVNELLQ